MSGHAKAARGLGQNGAGAAAKFVHTSAFAAVEVMMVGLTGDLVASGLAGQRNGIEPAFREQRLDIAVDGRDAERAIVTLGSGECFFRREGAVRFGKGIADGLFLASIAWNGLRHEQVNDNEVSLPFPVCAGIVVAAFAVQRRTPCE